MHLWGAGHAELAEQLMGMLPDEADKEVCIFTPHSLCLGHPMHKGVPEPKLTACPEEVKKELQCLSDSRCFCLALGRYQTTRTGRQQHLAPSLQDSTGLRIPYVKSV